MAKAKSDKEKILDKVMKNSSKATKDLAEKALKELLENAGIKNKATKKELALINEVLSMVITGLQLESMTKEQMKDSTMFLWAYIKTKISKLK